MKYDKTVSPARRGSAGRDGAGGGDDPGPDDTRGRRHIAPSQPAAVTYNFRTLNNDHDVTFNQLLGINNELIIAGYFGSGAQGHPNKGYLLFPPLYGQQEYSNQNFPGSVQAQVTGLNDHGTYVGFCSSSNNADLVNANFG